MNDTSRQILSTNKSISTQVAKFCRLTSRFCKILSIKTLFKQKQGIKYTLFKFPKSLNNGLNRSFLYEFSLLSRTFPDSPKILSIKIPGFPEISRNFATAVRTIFLTTEHDFYSDKINFLRL